MNSWWKGTACGTLYLPAQARGPVGAVALAHGWSMVAGGDLEDYAAAIVEQGMAALTFDFRNLGRSDGQPRQEIDPQRQIQDFRAAISYLRRRPEVDRERIGIWGSSYSGGHALTVAAIDKRVKCVVSQVPTTSGFLAAQRRALRQGAGPAGGVRGRPRSARCGPAARHAAHGRCRSRGAGGVSGARLLCLHDRRSEALPAWVNEVTLRSLELARAYEPAAYIRRIAPTPLLMIVATGDGLTPADLQQEAFNTAHQPKQLLLLPGGHYPSTRNISNAPAARRRLVRPAPALTPQGQDNDDNNNGDTRPPAPPGFAARGGRGQRPEWFDWTLYGTFSAYLAMNLFDPSDPTSALLATLAVFAGGFLARPVGGWLFRIGDRWRTQVHAGPDDACWP